MILLTAVSFWLFAPMLANDITAQTDRCCSVICVPKSTLLTSFSESVTASNYNLLSLVLASAELLSYFSFLFTIAHHFAQVVEEAK